MSKYKSKNLLMDFDIIKKSIVYFSKYYQIGSITFYGGEPTLNFPVIEKSVSFINKYINDRNKLPSFKIITNGSCYNIEWVEFLKKNNIEITISIDGPKDIHNFNRKYKSGKYSFNDVIKSIKLFKQYNIKLTFDATYTPEHIKRGYTPFDIVNYINKKIDIKNGILIYANGLFDQEQKLRLDEKFIEKYINDHLKSFPPPKIPNLDNFISPIIDKNNTKISCSGGDKYFAIDAFGDIYPCHGFFGNKHFVIGNIINLEKKVEFQNKLNNKENIINNCNNCWMNILCVICPAEFYKENESLFPDEEYCEKKKQIMENVIIKLSEIVTNEEKNNKFLKNWKKNRTMSL